MNSQNHVMKNKYFLYATGFFSGMSVMAIELGASRLLAPYFSSSQIVWTVIIGTIMIAMALGNVWGGRSADKNPDPTNLYRRLLLVAVWTAAIPFVGKYVIAGITLVLAVFVNRNFLVWASFSTCIVLFVFPLMMLGTVTPSLMKYATSSLDDNGKTVGELEALGTIGSIIGTFLPTFVTIPTVGTATTFLIFASVLACLSLIYFISIKKHQLKTGVAAILIIIMVFVPFKYSFAFWNDNLAYEGESIYNYLQVQDNKENVILSTNVMEGVQSIMIKGGGLTGMYYDVALAAPLMAGKDPAQQNVLILGMGTGTYAKQCLSYYPGIQTEGVEIDEKIVGLANKYFELPEDVKVDVYDGRAFLQNAGKYDVIMVDAYQDITIPFQMSTVEFFTQVKNHLAQDGVMVVNMNMRSSKEGAINDYLSDTIASVFPCVATVPVYNGTNTELFAGNSEEMFENLSERSRQFSDESELRTQMDYVEKNMNAIQGGNKILTDDKAPVELLGMRVLDETIAKQLSQYRTAFSEGGIEELLREF